MTRRPYRSKRSQGPRVAGEELACRECSQRKPIDAFRVLASGSRESYCRSCHNAINREWRARNRDDLNARRRAAYAAARSDD